MKSFAFRICFGLPLWSDYLRWREGDAARCSRCCSRSSGGYSVEPRLLCCAAFWAPDSPCSACELWIPRSGACVPVHPLVCTSAATKHFFPSHSTPLSQPFSHSPVFLNKDLSMACDHSPAVLASPGRSDKTPCLLFSCA